MYDNALRPYDVTVAQLNLLAAVAQLEPIPAGKLADLLSLQISTLSRNVRLMVWRVAQGEAAELLGPDARRALKSLGDGLLAAP